MRNEVRFWRVSDLIFIFLCFVCLYLQVFIVPASPIYFEEDHVIIINDAWRMYKGDVIYRDFFQFTFPGAQVIYLIFLDLFGIKYWIINLVILVQGLSHGIIWLVISKLIFGSRLYTFLPVSLFLFFGFRWFGIDGSHGMLGLIPVGLAILALLKINGKKRLVAAGACCAASSFFTQQRGILVVAAIAVFLLVERMRARTVWKRLLIEEMILAGTFISTLLILLLPFIVSAGSKTFYEYTVGFIQNYVQSSNYNNYALLRNLYLMPTLGILVSAVAFFYYVLIPLVYIVSFVYFWRQKYDARVLLVSLVGFFLALGTFAPTPARVFQIGLPALTVFVWLGSRLIKRFEFLAVSAVISLAIFGLALAIRTQMTWEHFYLNSPSGKLVFVSEVPLERFQWLVQHSQPGDYVFEAYEPTINFALQLPNPARVPFVLDNGYTPDWQVKSTIDDLKRKQPKFIIWDGKWSKPADQRAPGDGLAPLYDYLIENYELDHAFTPYSNRRMEAWRRKSNE